MRVSDIMSAPVYTIEANETAAAAWETMFFCRTRHLVVTDAEGHVVGVVSASDLGGKKGEPLRARRRVRDLMTEKLVTTTPETTVREAANLMRGHTVSCLPVFNGRDRLKGIVTVVDLLELIGRGMERPTKAVERVVLKDRGVVPRQATARNRTKLR
ncbi:MAG TPA: CBS domain-containing protein [Vicinamibacterales bacterium]|nr:CBS domain-containing protein [Vicinamibacterales bacterium]